jgi:hypothetical protein
MITSQLTYYPRAEEKTEDKSGENRIRCAQGKISEDIKSRDNSVQGIQHMIDHEYPSRPCRRSPPYSGTMTLR